jgi:hypothetical protein
LLVVDPTLGIVIGEAIADAVWDARGQPRDIVAGYAFGCALSALAAETAR